MIKARSDRAVREQQQSGEVGLAWSSGFKLGNRKELETKLASVQPAQPKDRLKITIKQ